MRTGCCTTEDGVEYYQRELNQLNKQIENWKLNLQKGSGFAFITFKTKAGDPFMYPFFLLIDATRCIVDARNKKLANLSKQLESHAWKVSQAQESR